MNDNQLVKFQIERQKMMIGKYNNELNDQLIIPIQKLGEEIAIVVADFKCQKCSATDELQIHHLITRIAKELLPIHRYVSQRYYWANMVLICKTCHKKLHFIHSDHDERYPMKCISQLRFDEIKQKYGIV